MRASKSIPALLCVILVLGGCGEGSGVVVVENGGTLTVTADPSTGTTTPTYRWDGGAALELSVTRADGTGVAWRIEALTLDDGFSPPVQQGVVPQGARQTLVGDVLESGVQYRVTVETVTGDRGSTLFVP